MKSRYFLFIVITYLSACQTKENTQPTDLWSIYEDHLAKSKYVDLTFAFHPDIPVWPGFSSATFSPAVAGNDLPGYASKGDTFTIAQHGFRATAYHLTTDQYGTQLDPPAHWNPQGATISDLPATYAVRPLVVIDIHEQVAQDAGYHCDTTDILSWEAENGKIPAGSVVMIRSDWHKRWNERERYVSKPFPGITLSALQFLHNQRNILFHGHEPLDTDTTGNLEGEYWLLNNNFCQAEGVTNLDQVPVKGALISIGFAKPEGGTGGFARYIAICPPDWKHGYSVSEQPGAPLPVQTAPLKRDDAGVLKPISQ